jgi:hypothetical protein
MTTEDDVVVGFAYQGKGKARQGKDIVFRFIIEYNSSSSSSRGLFGPLDNEIIGLFFAFLRIFES